MDSAKTCRQRQSELLFGTNDFSELIALKLPSGHALHADCAGRSLYEPRAHKEHSVWAGLALKKLPRRAQAAPQRGNINAPIGSQCAQRSGRLARHKHEWCSRTRAARDGRCRAAVAAVLAIALPREVPWGTAPRTERVGGRY